MGKQVEATCPHWRMEVNQVRTWTGSGLRKWVAVDWRSRSEVLGSF